MWELAGWFLFQKTSGFSDCYLSVLKLKALFIIGRNVNLHSGYRSWTFQTRYSQLSLLFYFYFFQRDIYINRRVDVLTEYTFSCLPHTITACYVILNRSFDLNTFNSWGKRGSTFLPGHFFFEWLCISSDIETVLRHLGPASNYMCFLLPQKMA